MKVIYLINWYKDKNEARHKELEQCLENVIDNAFVDEVCLLMENIGDGVDFACEKVTAIKVESRPTYNDFIRIANEISESGDVVIFGNTDIYPEDDTICDIVDNIADNECYALARWDVDANGNKTLLDRWDTADIWVFKAPIKPNIQGDFYLGQAGCDNAIADRIMQAGYKVLNPSRTIKFNHLHLSGVINYSDRDRIKKPYLLITPHNLGEEPSYNHVL